MELTELSIELKLLILSLATWRLSSLLANEDGPFDMFQRFRYVIGVRVDPIGQVYYLNTFAKGVACIWCNSIWVGIMLTLGIYVAPYATIWSILPLMLSAVVAFYQRIVIPSFDNI